jgi:nickel transport protein
MTLRLASIGVCWLCLGSVGHAHGIKASGVDGGIGVVATYDDGSPVSFSEAKVFAPGADDRPILTGTTDRNGCFMFRPDTHGIWKVAVDDGMGHAVTTSIHFEGHTVLPVQGNVGMPRRYGVVTGLALIFGVFGWAAFLRLRLAGKRGA